MPDAVRSSVGRMEFGPSVVPELRDILLNVLGDVLRS